MSEQHEVFCAQAAVLDRERMADARWLATLLVALQSHAEHRGYPWLAALLTPALDAAQAIADGEEPGEASP